IRNGATRQSPVLDSSLTSMSIMPRRHHAHVNYLLPFPLPVLIAENNTYAPIGGAVISGPIGFDITVPPLYTPLLASGRVRLLRAGEERESLEALLAHKPSGELLCTTPSLADLACRSATREAIAGPPATVILAGERTESTLIRRLRACRSGLRIVNGFGPI